MKTGLVLFIALIACLTPTFLLADGLRVGDAAPPVAITKWVRGDKLDIAGATASKKVIVVEFWATWCGPCIVSIPHLTKLQKEFADKGVVVVGVTRPDQRNTLEAVEKFVKEKGDTMAYTVAFDGDGKTYASYMQASGQRGIPTAFIVDRAGKLAWIGHPMRMDKPLAQIVAGSFDTELETIRSSLQNRVGRLLRANKTEPALRALAALAALDPDDPSPWQTRFAILLRAKDEKGAVQAAARAIDIADDAQVIASFAASLLRLESVDGARELALKAARKAIRVGPDNDMAAMVLMQVLLEGADQAAALGEAKKLIAASQENAAMLNTVAWTLLTEGKPAADHFALALKAAERCHVITKGENWMYLDTLALAKFKTGAKQEALELQRKAVGMAEKANAPRQTLEELQERLEEFAKAVGKPPRRKIEL